MDEIMMKKAEFLSNNKDAIIHNMTTVSYPLFKILNSDEDLEENEDYNKLINYFENKKVNKLVYRDEKYILQTILGIIDRLSTSIQEKEEARTNLDRYNKYFEKRNSKIKVRRA